MHKKQQNKTILHWACPLVVVFSVQRPRKKLNFPMFCLFFLFLRNKALGFIGCPEGRTGVQCVTSADKLAFEKQTDNTLRADQSF